MDRVIRVEHVKKIYKIYNDPKDLFKEAVGMSKGKQFHM